MTKKLRVVIKVKLTLNRSRQQYRTLFSSQQNSKTWKKTIGYYFYRATLARIDGDTYWRGGVKGQP